MLFSEGYCNCLVFLVSDTPGPGFTSGVCFSERVVLYTLPPPPTAIDLHRRLPRFLPNPLSTIPSCTAFFVYVTFSISVRPNTRVPRPSPLQRDIPIEIESLEHR